MTCQQMVPGCSLASYCCQQQLLQESMYSFHPLHELCLAAPARSPACLEDHSAIVCTTDHRTSSIVPRIRHTSQYTTHRQAERM